MSETPQSPSTMVGDSAKNPDGQWDTMKGSTGTFTPPHAELNDTKSIMIDPTSRLGCKGGPSC
jgi:hypothetical protein